MKYFIIFLWALLLISCTTTSINIQNAVVEGNQSNLPVRISEKKSADKTILQLGFTKQLNNDLKFNSGTHTLVNENQVFEVEKVPDKEYFKEVEGKNRFNFDGENFSWNFPKYSFYANIEHLVSEKIALKGGLNYAEVNENQYWSGNIGLGYITHLRNSGLRFDIDLIFRSFNTKLQYVEIKEIPVLFGEDRQEISFLSMDRKETNTSFNFGLTYNTDQPDWFLNYILSLNFGSINIIDYEFNTRTLSGSDYELSDKIEYSNQYTNVTFGLFKTFDNKRIILACRLHNNEDLNRTFFDNSRWSPEIMFQFDFLF